MPDEEDPSEPARPVLRELSVSVDMTWQEPEATGPATVGWLFTEERASLIHAAPRPFRADVVQREDSKGAPMCPALRNYESRLFEIPCPFDMTLAFERSDLGAPSVRDALGSKSAINPQLLDNLVIVSPETAWRHPDRPVLQIRLPYVFVSDDQVYMSQIPPMQAYQPDPWPGVMLAGRFPIHIWPRALSWAFEWHDPTRPLTLRRGGPFFCVQFETQPQNRPVNLIEAARTPDLDLYLERIAGVVNYVNRTFSLFEEAEARRPGRLVQPVR